MGVRVATMDDAGGPCAEVSADRRRRLWGRRAAWTLVRTSEDVVVTMVDDTTATTEPCVVTDMEAFEVNGRRAEAQVTAERVRVRLELLDGDRWSVARVENGRGEC